MIIAVVSFNGNMLIFSWENPLSLKPVTALRLLPGIDLFSAAVKAILLYYKSVIIMKGLCIVKSLAGGWFNYTKFYNEKVIILFSGVFNAGNFSMLF